ncbi:mechanosensitive ion channel domain-containing protein [Novosphingobium sp.]|uniref:mechanosensitive ion channel family protein n=1 Tax=Novosphingobium sp. TaxID=1874826 RepID=UPI0025D93E09|nr:mechanosensitive ion channel domain-containing protein [Novosphingobium sp.]
MTVSIRPEVPTRLIERHSTIADFVRLLDSWGFNAGETRISVWTILVVIVIVTGLILAARMANRFVVRALTRMTRLGTAQSSLVEKLASIAIWAVAFFVGIDLLGVNLTALTVFSGAFGLAIGFGLQKTFGNLIAGIILLMDRSIKPGDVIAVGDGNGGTFGQVKKIGIRAVSVTTRDQKEYLIPNENLMVNQVENWSYSSKNVRIQVPVGISYGSDIELAESLMLQAAREAKRILNKPAPVVWLAGFGDNSVDFIIQCWINDPEDGLGNVRSDVLKRLWHLFAENGIGLPFPQRDINLQDSAAFRALLDAMKARKS